MLSRPTVAVGLLMLFALGWSGEFLVETALLRPGAAAQREIAAYDGERFARLRPLLPPGEVVGLVGGGPGEPEPGPGALYLIQYVLAPAVVVRDPARPFVVTNFRDPTSVPHPPPGRRYILLEDLGNGVQLYRTEAE